MLRLLNTYTFYGIDLFGLLENFLMLIANC